MGWPHAGWGMVKLTPPQQALFVRVDPAASVPVQGGWRLRGSTNIELGAAKKRGVQQARTIAWQNVAPKRLNERKTK